MTMTQERVHEAVDETFREDWGRIVATLIRQFGDFELAEDVAQEAFAAALAQWPSTGVPDCPRAWIVTTARRRAIDSIRRRERHRSILLSMTEEEPVEEGTSDIADDRLRLICTCCHPALAVEAQVALTLRTLGGLTTEEIARAFLIPEATMAQRLVRAQRKIRDARIPYRVPDQVDLPERLDAILTTIYLIFNQGYSSTAVDLCAEAIRLGRVVREMTDDSETTALLALMLLQDSRRAARFDAVGEIVLLDEQDRTLWNRGYIDEALPMVAGALRVGVGPYALQAAIASVHARASSADATDWAAIARLYTQLGEIQPSPVVTLNRAVAVAALEGPAAALALVDSLAEKGELDRYHLFHAARAEFLRRLDRPQEAALAYRRAHELAVGESERRFLERRLQEVVR